MSYNQEPKQPVQGYQAYPVEGYPQNYPPVYPPPYPPPTGYQGPLPPYPPYFPHGYQGPPPPPSQCCADHCHHDCCNHGPPPVYPQGYQGYFNQGYLPQQPQMYQEPYLENQPQSGMGPCEGLISCLEGCFAVLCCCWCLELCCQGP